MMFLLYVGPDQMMPLLSILGAAIGVALMWWRRLITLVGRGLRMLTRKPTSPLKQRR